MTPPTAVAIASDLIRCPSITPQDGGVMGVLEEYLSKAGFTVERLMFDDPLGEPTENLYARMGDAAPNVCFAGHVDVVPPGDEQGWTYPPFEPTITEDGWLYGRGAEDMKGALASFVAAALRIGKPTNGSISLLITGDEEGDATNGTQKVIDWLKEKGETIDACIVGEPTNPTYLGEMIKVGRRGSITCDLFVYGKQGHVAYPDLANNPLTKLVNAINEMQNYVLDEGSDFFPPSNFEVTTMDVGNKTVNMIPHTAHAKFNIRFNDHHTGASIEEWLIDVCDRHIKDAKYELKCRVSGEAFLTQDEKLTKSLTDAMEQVTGHYPTLSTTGGTSDARFIKDICPVIECGTTGMTAHMIDERVQVGVLEQLSDVYELAVRNYLGH